VERNEAVALLKEVAHACKYSEEEAILIVPQVQNSLITGFMLHIKKTLDKSELECIEDILKKHKLAMQKQAGTILIYKPTI
jgi:hypothetical protein